MRPISSPPRRCAANYVVRAKIEAVVGVIVMVFAPLVAVLAIALLWHALVTVAGIIIAAAAATSIQLWFRTQAKRSQFRRRQVSSRIATFAEAFSSIGWAATAAVAAVNLWLAIAPGLLAFLVVTGTWFMSPVDIEFEHDLVRKRVTTFRDHALTPSRRGEPSYD